jgi:hypothetical protein
VVVGRCDTLALGHCSTLALRRCTTLVLRRCTALALRRCTLLSSLLGMKVSSSSSRSSHHNQELFARCLLSVSLIGVCFIHLECNLRSSCRISLGCHYQAVPRMEQTHLSLLIESTHGKRCSDVHVVKPIKRHLRENTMVYN